MRILVVGAGAIGGYFGGRMLQAGSDVTFLVRPRRAGQLRDNGLVIQSPAGDVVLRDPPSVQAGALRQSFDLILLSCKAYDLAGAMDSFATALGPQSFVLPLLNGMRHLDLLDTRFGSERVLGGQCIISAMLDPEGRIHHLSDFHLLSFGSRTASQAERIELLHQEMARAAFEVRLSATIVQEMWEKWVFIAALAGITCLMRATIGDLVAVGAAHLAATLYDECAQISGENGFVPGHDTRQRSLAVSTAAGSGLTASMLRDVESGRPTEGAHILGDLLARRQSRIESSSLLAIADTHLRAYEQRRAREQARPSVI